MTTNVFGAIFDFFICFKMVSVKKKMTKSRISMQKSHCWTSKMEIINIAQEILLFTRYAEACGLGLLKDFFHLNRMVK